MFYTSIFEKIHSGPENIIHKYRSTAVGKDFSLLWVAMAAILPVLITTHALSQEVDQCSSTLHSGTVSARVNTISLHQCDCMNSHWRVPEILLLTATRTVTPVEKTGTLVWLHILVYHNVGVEKQGFKQYKRIIVYNLKGKSQVNKGKHSYYNHALGYFAILNWYNDPWWCCRFTPCIHIRVKV